jgi:hypothetical protein
MKRGKDTGDQDSVEKRGESEETKEGKQRSTSGNKIMGSADDTGYPGRFQRSSGKSREDENLKSISSQADDSDKDLHALQQEEMSGSEEEDIRSASYSDTDEDENEGLGDGKLGRTVRRGLEE